MPDLKVGDKVRVFDVNGRRQGQPEGAWVGEVVKAGRKLVTIKYGWRVQVFRIEGQRANDSYGHQHFKSPEQAERDLRASKARGVLRERRIKLDWDAKFTVEQLEALAELVKSFDVKEIE